MLAEDRSAVLSLRVTSQMQSKLADALVGRLALASLDRLAVAAFIVDRESVLHLLNAAARTLLARHRCVRVSNGRLRFRHPGWNTVFDVALRSAIQNPGRNSLLSLSSRDAEVYEVNVSSLQGDAQLACTYPLPLALAVIADLQPDAQRIVQRVRPLYGLTEAEARVMAELALGRTVEEVAAAHGVRPSTVRAQVRSIFEKTGVHRQTDLVRLALTGAPLVGSCCFHLPATEVRAISA